ncbi:MAG: MBOAT family O-acyltransferase [Planctomycetota bacterium]
MLGFFKYFDFFASGAAELLRMIGLPLEPRLLHLILPAAISFYTFQTLSYTIDVYRGQIRAEKSLLNFAVFVAFFPQLVSGPILRASYFLPQVARQRRLQLNQIYHGAYWVLWGLFKKIVIADNLAIIVQRVFDNTPANCHGGTVLIALYAFAFQIYCDFSGYTDIARGCGRIMGFDIYQNFNLPYFASNPTEFWRRWHISLSTWFRDYLYIPLGGNRHGIRRTCINLMLTMALCGLWHGAAWTFVIWGIYHGLLIIGHRTLKPFIERVCQKVPARYKTMERGIMIVVFFHYVCIGWLIFRAESLSQVKHMIDLLSSVWLEWIMGAISIFSGTGIVTVAAAVLPLLTVQLAQYWKNDLDVILRLPAFARGLIYTAMIYGIILFGSPEDIPFIYFQF